MKENNYLVRPGKECMISSSQDAYNHMLAKKIRPLQCPVPGISARPEDEKDTGFFVWNVKSAIGTHVVPFFDYEELRQRYAMLTFRRMEPGEMFLYDGRLYMVKFDRHRGFYLQHIFFFYRAFFAKAEAAIRGYVGAEFMLCRVYVVGRVKKLLGICWIGYVEETGDTIFIKLFQDDVDKFMAYDPIDFAREAIDVGEVFSYYGKCWKLCLDSDGFQYVDEVDGPKMKVLTMRKF